MPRRATTETKPVRLAQLVAARTRTAGLIEPGQRILVSVSGGPDSVALLSILQELAPTWRLTLHAAHINHELRGEESEEDARFVARLCDRFGIPLHCERVPMEKPGAKAHRSSLQERAREARYQVLRRLSQALTADRVALGHQADDQAETLLMWMLRGAGTAGLAGIPSIRESLFIRPLLGIAREAILQYLWSREVPFRLDSSNAKPMYMRNRIRQELLPAMRRFNPAVVESLARQADILREEDAYLHQVACQAMAPLVRHTDRGILIDRAGLLALPLTLQRRILRLLLQHLHPRRQGPGFKTIASLLETVFAGRAGSSFSLQGVRATQEYDVVRLQSNRPAPAATLAGAAPSSMARSGLTLPVPAAIHWPLTGQVIHASVAGPYPPPRQALPRNLAVFDLDRISMPLTVRSWQAGDAFQPAGMGGRTKKLQDFFSDIKVPRQARPLVPIVLAPEGILWVAGYRADHRFRAQVGTQRIVRLELLEASSEGGAD